ncbi:MAG: hypothetical protein Q4B89_00920 [Lachnospiraceae bacterium]|nr:hypothetical protein [Lachnospiraceae bacterium]
MKISVVENKKEIKLEEVEVGKYYLIDFSNETIEDLHYMKVRDIKAMLDVVDCVIIEVEREEK